MLNPAKNERVGAGIKAAQYITNQQVKVLITGSLGLMLLKFLTRQVLRFTNSNQEL